MEIKKIIPLSLAAMSVMGALTACSDDKVVGADEHENTMALNSSSSAQPESSSSIGELDLIPEETLALLKSVGKGVAVTIRLSLDETGSYWKDTVDATGVYESVVDSILETDSVRFMGVDSVYENIMNMPPDENRSTALKEYRLNFQTNTEVMIVMKDEAGLVHGPIGSYFGSVGSPERHHGVVCLRQIEDIRQDGGALDYRYALSLNEAGDGSGFVLEKTLVYFDPDTEEEFKQDCALENGEIKMMDWTESILGRTYTELSCSIPLTFTEGIPTYKDPHWEKYGRRIIENCVTTQSIDDIAF